MNILFKIFLLSVGSSHFCYSQQNLHLFDLASVMAEDSIVIKSYDNFNLISIQMWQKLRSYRNRDSVLRVMYEYKAKLDKSPKDSLIENNIALFLGFKSASIAQKVLLEHVIFDSLVIEKYKLNLLSDNQLSELYLLVPQQINAKHLSKNRDTLERHIQLFNLNE